MMDCIEAVANEVPPITSAASSDKRTEEVNTAKRRSPPNPSEEPKSKLLKIESCIGKNIKVRRHISKLKNVAVSAANNIAQSTVSIASVVKPENSCESSSANKWSISKAGKCIEFSSCVNCGLSGVTKDFVEQGQFCSEQCQKLKRQGNGGEPSTSGNAPYDPLKLFPSLKLGTPPVQSTVASGTSAPAVLCIPNCPSVPATTGDNKQGAGPTGTISSTIGLINLRIANGEILPGVSQVNKVEPNLNAKMPTSFPLLLPVGNNQSIFVQSPGIGKNLGQSMMLLKPVVSGAVTNNVVSSTVSLPNGPLVTPVNTVNDPTGVKTSTTTVSPKTVILPLIQSAASTQQTLSTPSGQQIQITLAPQNKKSVPPVVSSCNNVANSIQPTFTFGPITSQNRSTSNFTPIEPKPIISQAASSAEIGSIFSQTSSTAISSNVVTSTQAPLSNSNSLNTQSKEKTDFNEKKNVDVDFAEVLEWDGDVGRLLGSDLKFKYNEFGSLEQVLDDSPANPKKDKDDKDGSVVDEDLCCLNCGCFGEKSEFCEDERFCSISCIGAYKNSQKAVKDSRKIKTIMASKPMNSNIVEAKPYEPKPYARKMKSFNWEDYLKDTSSEAAPPNLFKNPYPSNKNGFKGGMKLEGIDPNHQSMFCVLTVADVLGHRLLLHFDGYSDNYDFWVNADSTEIFPVGWCDKTGHPLHPPKDHPKDTPFNWQAYLSSQNAQGAPRHLYAHVSKDNTQITGKGFRRGVYLEAVDKKNYNLICVVSITDTIENRFLLHFDGWDDSYDYWVDPSSPFIHPVRWCERNNLTLTPPKNFELDSDFDWDEFLKQKKASAAPPRAFRPRQPVEFKVGQKLEAVDLRNPALIRVATVKEKNGHTIKLAFDGWDSMYDFWVDDDSPDIHPVNWCMKTGHPLQPHPSGATDFVSSCKTHGCSGVGHFKGPKHTSHHSAYGCPYAPSNLNKDSGIQDRLGVFKEDIIISTLPFKKTSILNGVSEAIDFLKDDISSSKKCPTVGCDGSGHVTGKFVNHYSASGCPLVKKEPEGVDELVPPLKRKRGRKKKNFKDYVTGEFFNTEIPSEPLRSVSNAASIVPTKAIKDKVLTSKVVSENGKQVSAIPNPDEQLILMMNNVHRSVFYTGSQFDLDEEFNNRWDEHVKFLPMVEKEKSKNVNKWSVKQVYEFIEKLPVRQEIAQRILSEEIDGQSLLLINQSDLIKILGIKVGPAVIIYNSILKLQRHCNLLDDL